MRYDLGDQYDIGNPALFAKYQGCRIYGVFERFGATCNLLHPISNSEPLLARQQHRGKVIRSSLRVRFSARRAAPPLTR